MTTTVKAAGAAQFLALVPRLLGYLPRRSVVVVPMGGGRSLGAMRLDLPTETAGPSEYLAATVIGMVCRVTGADGFIAVIYTDECSDPPLPRADLADALVRAADASGLAVLDVLTVAADGWFSHLQPLGASGPLSDLITTDPASLPAVRGDQAAGAHLPAHSAAERRAVGSAYRSLRSAVALVCGAPEENAHDVKAHPERIDPRALAAACELDDLPRLFERAINADAASVSAMDAALLGWCLDRPAVRDVALVQWTSDLAGGERAMEAQRRWEDGEEYPAELAAVMWGEGPLPDPPRVEAALERVRHVAALTAKRRRAGALSMCAWLSWALGRSTHADLYAAMALEIDPGHGLAEIVRSFVSAAHLPDWAFRRG